VEEKFLGVETLSDKNVKSMVNLINEYRLPIN
jgi:hypothetical protein